MEETISNGAGSHDPLGAVAQGRAWKDGTKFKWFSKTMVKNTDYEIKGEYILFYAIPHTPVIVKINREDLVDVNADLNDIAYAGKYRGETGAVFAIQSTQPFTDQNAITEVDKIGATAYIHGKPLSDNDPNSANKYECSANLPSCECEDRNGEDDQGSITPTNPNQTPSPGNAFRLKVDTDGEPYYWIDLSALTPWGTNESVSTVVEGGRLGDGTKTEAEFTYTFPSGAMHTGDYQFTARIYRWSDMSEYEITNTITVKNLGITPTNPNQTHTPGDTFEFTVVTETPYYWIEVFVKGPGDTSERGTRIVPGTSGN